MITYPLSFFSSASALSGIKNNWEIEASGNKAMCSVPVEFEGPGGAFSPEDFFLLAAQNCFIATFKVYAEYSKLSFESLEVKSELIVDKNEENKPVMKTVKFFINVAGVSDEKKANLLIKKTFENGFILQSVKSQLVHEVIFN